MISTPNNSARSTAAVTSIAPRQNEYLRYLESSRWRNLARAVRMRAKGKCEICWRADGEECAHLTYERVFNERMSDLIWVCKKCHRELDDRQQRE